MVAVLSCPPSSSASCSTTFFTTLLLMCINARLHRHETAILNTGNTCRHQPQPFFRRATFNRRLHEPETGRTTAPATSFFSESSSDNASNTVIIRKPAILSGWFHPPHQRWCMNQPASSCTGDRHHQQYAAFKLTPPRVLVASSTSLWPAPAMTTGFNLNRYAD